ncbi:hypothetical protein J6590_009745 [Homalodisca vitripennis]|nr:hypothetical protein J6590_009745 [Homalodisca vitripennis]
MHTQQGSLLAGLYLPGEPALGRAKTDVSLKSVHLNLMDVLERHILGCKDNSIGLVYCGR